MKNLICYLFGHRWDKEIAEYEGWYKCLRCNFETDYMGFYKDKYYIITGIFRKIKHRIKCFLNNFKYIRPIEWVRKQFRSDDKLPF